MLANGVSHMYLNAEVSEINVTKCKKRLSLNLS